MKSVILLGSSRKHGHSHQIAEELSRYLKADSLDLLDFNIGHYDYTFRNQEDDFISLLRDITDRYQRIIFITPVYWYTMSGLMKVFFDRITDGLKIAPELGEAMKGMHMAAIAVGSDPDPIEGFFVPFRLTAPYMEMKYDGDTFVWMEEGMAISAECTRRLREFAASLQKSPKSILPSNDQP